MKVRGGTPNEALRRTAIKGEALIIGVRRTTEQRRKEPLMTRLRRASVIAALSLLASAATASAEGAWVLWRQSISDSQELWVPQEVYANVSECRAIEELKNRAKERLRDLTPSEKRLIPDFSYLCLPDTVDPRGPKGK